MPSQFAPPLYVEDTWAAEIITDQVEAFAEAGDALDWTLAVFAYRVAEPLTYDGHTVEPGTYVRTVVDNVVALFTVDNEEQAREIVDQVEQAFTTHNAMMAGDAGSVLTMTTDEDNR